MELNREMIAVLGKYIQLFSENCILFREGEFGSNFYILVEGSVAITKKREAGSSSKEIVLANLEKGDFFGEMSVFTGKNRSATAKTLTQCQLVVLDKKAVEYVIQVRPQFAFKIIETLCQRLDRIDEFLVRALDQTAETIEEETEEEKVTNETLPGSSHKGLSQKELDKVVKLSDKISMENFTKLKCAACGGEFQQYWPSFSSFKLRGRETDFKPQYEEENMLYYNIWVCPHCGYAAYRKDFGEQDAGKAQKLSSGSRSDGKMRSLTEKRHQETAVLSYLRAIECYRRLEAPPSKTASLYQQLAWLYREAKDTENEIKLLRLALNDYMQFYQNGDGSFPKDLGEAGIIYLIGELHLRLADYKSAVDWIQRALRHPDLKSKPFIEKMARDRLDDARKKL